MYASLRIFIRSVDLSSMLRNVFNEHWNGFQEESIFVFAGRGPVPANMEHHLEGIICRARQSQNLVSFINQKNYQIAIVETITDAKKTRKVLLSSEQKHCFLAAIILLLETASHVCMGCGNFWTVWTVNVHKYISVRKLCFNWKLKYQGFSFGLPLQSDVDRVVTRVQQLFAFGEHTRISVALTPHCGRPVKREGNRESSWHEKGSTRYNLRYACSLCDLTGHTVRSCGLRQLFEYEYEDEEREQQDEEDTQPAEEEA